MLVSLKLEIGRALRDLRFGGGTSTSQMSELPFSSHHGALVSPLEIHMGGVRKVSTRCQYPKK